MTVEDIEAVINKWENEQITLEQVIGKMLVMLREHKKRLLKLEATPEDKD